MQNDTTEIELAKLVYSFRRTNEPTLQEAMYRLELNDTKRFMPYDAELRLKRSFKENISLISSTMICYLSSHSFQVKGSTGQIYTVKIGPKINCTCQDYNMRNKHCKHIFYILVQELKVQDLKNKLFTTLNPSQEVLEQIFIKYHT